MNCYFALFFPREIASQSRLKNWLIREGSLVDVGQDLLIYGEGALQKKLSSKISGVLKATLVQESEILVPGQEIAIFKMDPESLALAVAQNLGKGIDPEEFKTWAPYAEAASIRIPQEPNES